MGVLIDEAGNRYGRLLVLSRVENDCYGKAMWLCRCDCSNEVIVIGSNLRGGLTKSCGCLVGTNRLPGGESAFNRLFRVMQQSAKVRGYTWELTREQMRALTKQDCYYCGIPPSQTAIYWSSEYIYNGIDRKDNDVGYVESNCAPCCKDCNLAKHTRTVQEFITWAIRVARYYKKMKGDGERSENTIVISEDRT